MSERTVSTGKLMVLLLIGLSVFVAMTNYLTHTNDTETKACQPKKGILGKFQVKNVMVPVPDTVFFDGFGNERSLTHLKGRGIILNFWASWCAPCVREMPQLNRLKNLLASRNIDVLAVSQDRQGVKLVEKFLAKNKLYNLEALVDKNGQLIRAVNGYGLPTTIIFDRKGHEVGRVLGAAEWDSPESLSFIRKCLGD